MKKGMIFCGLWIIAAVVCAANSLPLSKSGQQEGALYLDFLQTATTDASSEKLSCTFYERSLAKFPENKYLRRQMMMCFLAENKLEQAEQYADYFNLGENDEEDLMIYGFYHLRKGDLLRARSYYEQALEKAPEDPRVLYQYITLLSALDVDQAAQVLQERKAALPGMAAKLDYETGNLYSRRKQFKTALEYYQKATQADPSFPDPYLARAEIYEKTSQFFLMMHELEELEKVGYQSAPMYSRMGSFYTLVKDKERAKTYFLKAKALDNADDSAGYFLALYAEQEGNLAQAAQYLRETADYQTSASRQLQVSFYEQQSGDSKAALHTLQEAYKRFAGNVEIGYFYGLLLHDEKQYRSAAKVLKGVLETNPDYENARMAYAFCLEELGRYKEMEKQVRLILSKNPNHAVACNLLGFSLANRNIRLEEAQELVTKAVAMAPKDRAYIDSLAWVYYQQGKYSQALELLQSIDANFIAENDDVAYHIGAVYMKLGETEKALPYLQQAARSDKQAAKLLKKIAK